MAIDKPLRDFGPQSERVLMADKGPGKFEDEVANLEGKVGLKSRLSGLRGELNRLVGPDDHRWGN